MVIYTLQGIFTIALILLIIATVMCIVFQNPIIVFTIPGVLITLFILSTCIACPTPPTQSHGYIDAKAGSYGYLEAGDTTYIIPPGKSLFKWPWQKFTTTTADFTYFKTIEVPTQTTDGMRLMYNIGFPVDSVKFDPYKYHYLYKHNYPNYANHVIKKVQPIVDKWMAHVS